MSKIVDSPLFKPENRSATAQNKRSRSSISEPWKSRLYSLAALCLLTSILPGCTARSLSEMQAGESDAGAEDNGSPGNSEGVTSSNPIPTSGDDDGGDEGNDDGGDGGNEESDCPLFIGCLDFGAPDCGIECDPWAQDCPEGEKCTPRFCEPGANTWDYNSCVPIAGDGQPGDACLQVGDSYHEEDCAKGAMCWDYNEEGIGVCIALCVGSEMDPSCEDGDKACVIANQGVLPICLLTCDPLIQDCANGDLCLASFSEDEFICVLNASDDMAPYGSGCDYMNSCNIGLFCVSTEFVGEASCGSASGCCTPFCDLSDTAYECPGAALGQICQPYFEEDVPGYENVGMCVISE